MKPSKRAFQIGLGILAALLLLYGGLRWKFGPFLPAAIDNNIPDFIMFAAIGVLLWNRKIRQDDQKEEAERQKREAAASVVAPLDSQPSLESEPAGEAKPGTGGTASSKADAED